MLIKRAIAFPIRSSEITPETVYRDRRRFLAGLGLGTIGVLTAGCGKAEDKTAAAPALPPEDAALAHQPALKVTRHTDFAAGETVTPSTTVTTYNNFYEFGTSKDEPAVQAARLKTRPWSVTVDGECEAPGHIDLDDLLKPYALEERVYRHRCVEGWSIVVPWVGFPLADLLKRFKPTSKAKYVAFFSLFDAAEMPYAGEVLPWPYREGLRIDEAMHPLAFMSVGLYGKALPNQNGAPLRLTLPWKYGFKSIKSIVHIKFKEEMPDTTWNFVGSDEYGFYANVNPEVDHPRWSQKTERRLGELFKRKTLMFNGYPEVAPLYTGMDLRKDF